MSDYTCKFDANRWQLYSTMRGVQAVAADLSGSLTVHVRKAMADLMADSRLSERKLAESVRDTMYTHLAGAAKFGASDSEPQCVLVAELERVFALDEYSLER